MRGKQLLTGRNVTRPQLQIPEFKSPSDTSVTMVRALVGGFSGAGETSKPAACQHLFLACSATLRVDNAANPISSKTAVPQRESAVRWRGLRSLGNRSG